MEIFDLIIIGGGFSGILLSYHVKTLAPNMKVGIIHPAKHLGGLAYSQATSSAVLNVPHWKMSALVDDSENFSKLRKLISNPEKFRNTKCAFSRLCIPFM